MKAIVLTGARRLSIEERPIPRPARGEMVLRVKRAAICGTDVRMWANAADDMKPLVLGHEIAGEIFSLGEGVAGYAPGERVAIAPNIGCGICDECASGRGHMCKTYKALGINLDGGFAEYALIPENAVRAGNVCKLGEEVTFEAACAVEPLSCVYNAFEHYRVNPGDSVLIRGAGPIGVMHAMLARMAGAGLVALNDLSPDRLALAKQLLPEIVVYSGDNIREFANEITRGRGFDAGVIACPSPAAQAETLELMGLFGRVCFFGGLPKDREPVAIDTNLIHYRQLTVTGTSRASLSQYRTCLRLVESGVIDLERVITNRFSPDEASDAFEFAQRAGGLKSVIEF